MNELQRKQFIAECVETYQRAAKKLGAALDQIADVERELEGQLGINQIAGGKRLRAAA